MTELRDYVEQPPTERVRTMTDLTTDSHHYIVLSLLYQWIREVAVPCASGVLLDYGCGGQPYRELFAPQITHYIGADVTPSSGIALDLRFHPGEALCLPDHSVDTVLSTQVLEHVSDPRFYLSECRRLLRPGGTLIITVPMQWRHHEVPIDFWRFTRFGLSELLESHGFLIADLRPCGGALALLGQILTSFLAERRVSWRLLYRAINLSFLALDRRFFDPDDTLNWQCIARVADSSSRVTNLKDLKT